MRKSTFKKIIPRLPNLLKLQRTSENDTKESWYVNFENVNYTFKIYLASLSKSMAGIGKGLGWVFGLSTVSLVGFVVFGYAESKSPQSVGRSTGRPVNRIPTGGIPVKANTSSEGYPVGLPPTSAENPVGVEQQPYTPTPYPTVAPVEQVPYNPPVGNQSPAINRSQNPCPEGIGSHTDTLGNIVCEYPPQNYAPEFLDEFINPKENASLTTEQMWDSLSEEEQQAIWGDYTRRQQTVTWDGYHKEDYFLYPHAG